MKKLLFIALMSWFTTASAEYMIFESKNINFSQIEKRENLFIGGYREYQKQLGEDLKINKLNIANGALEGLNKSGTGLAANVFSKAGEGMAAGAVINFVMKDGIDFLIGYVSEDIKFIKLDKLTFKDGSSKTVYKMIILSTENKLSSEEAIEILKKDTK